MNSRLTTRRWLSLMLALAIALWAEAGLAIPPAEAVGMRCHSQAMHADQPQLSEGGQASSPAAVPKESASSMPCCPDQPASPHTCGDPPCCTASDMPVRPLAFVLVPGTSLAKHSSAKGRSTAILPAPQPQAGVPATIAGAPLYVRPITEKKTDLRI